MCDAHLAESRVMMQFSSKVIGVIFFPSLVLPPGNAEREEEAEDDDHDRGILNGSFIQNMTYLVFAMESVDAFLE